MSSETPRSAVSRVRPTMRDVAALAGVSLKTVSRVVNGVITVDPALATKVNAAAAKLGFRPNLTASNLRRNDGRTSTIGMLVEDAANPFSGALMRAVEDVAHDRDVLVLVGSLDEDPARERKLVGALSDRRVDGLVIVPCGRDHGYMITERNAGMCVVFVDREPMHLDADAVVSENQQGAMTAVRHMLDHGHRRIGYLGDRMSISTAKLRFAGYSRSLELARIDFDERMIRSELTSVQAGYDATVDLLAQPEPPTALFASQNLITIGVCRALREMDLQDSVALVGFDDFPLAELLRPGITVITQDTERLGRLAAEILFDRMGGDESPARTVFVPTRLVARGSGEIRYRAAHDD